jgi:hypothetical protein
MNADRGGAAGGRGGVRSLVYGPQETKTARALAVRKITPLQSAPKNENRQPLAVLVSSAFLHYTSMMQKARSILIGAFGDMPLLADLRELCDGIGGRPTGSPACKRAIAWAAAECLVPERFALRIAAAPYGAATNGTLNARGVNR